MPEQTLSVLDGSTFLVGDRLGDLCDDSGREHGFFCADTRFLSRFILRVGDAPLVLLGLDQRAHYTAQFFLTPTVSPDQQAPCSIIRNRLIDLVWLEELTVINHLHERSQVHVSLDICTDFADLFEVKEGTVRKREITFEHDERTLSLAYEREGFERSLEICASLPGEITREGFDYVFDLAPGERWMNTFTITPYAHQRGAAFTPRRARGSISELMMAKGLELQRWLGSAPDLQSEDAGLSQTYLASLSDLGALRLQPDLGNERTLPAAGLPWFMALFGRDSLITSFQALPYLPRLAATTLRVLAGAQADSRDDFHEREPGKILHEQRFGELTARGERPHSPYYGTADATPLFLILLDEYHRWTGDEKLIRELEPNARAALEWIEQSGDADGDGYVEY